MGTRMIGTIARWGNSLAIRLPRATLDAARLREGDAVAITTDDHGRIIVESDDRVDLEALVAAMRPETFHDDDPWLSAPPIGEEIW
jgi:antitoxin MazE